MAAPSPAPSPAPATNWPTCTPSSLPDGELVTASFKKAQERRSSRVEAKEVKRLLEAEAKARRGLTPPSGAANGAPDDSEAGVASASAAARDGDVEAMQAFLKADPGNLDILVQDECTLLHLACEAGQSKVAELLIAAGASADVVDCDGQTPLHLAVAEAHIDTVRVLTNRENCGPMLARMDNYQMTPFHLACEGGCAPPRARRAPPRAAPARARARRPCPHGKVASTRQEQGDRAAAARARERGPQAAPRLRPLPRAEEHARRRGGAAGAPSHPRAMGRPRRAAPNQSL